MKTTGISRINSALRRCRKDLEIGIAEIEQDLAAAKAFLPTVDRLAAIETTEAVRIEAPSEAEQIIDKNLESVLAGRIAGRLTPR